MHNYHIILAHSCCLWSDLALLKADLIFMSVTWPQS